MMFKIFSLIALLLAPTARADSPAIWFGTTAKWLPSGLKTAGMCQMSATGVQTVYTTDGIIKMSSGVPGAATSGTDFAPATSGSAYLKGNGAGGFTNQSTPIPLADGGTNSTAAASAGSLAYSDASKIAFSAVGTTGQAAISGGTGAPTFFAPTAGSVVHAGTSGILAQDNSNFFYDSTNKRLGIGTATPRGNFDVLNTADSLLSSPTMAGQGGSDNNSWLFYASTTGTFSLWNRNQLLHGFGVNSFGNVLLGAGAGFGSPVATVVIQNGTGATTLPSLTVNAIASQSAVLTDWRSSDTTTVLAKVDVAGKIFATNLRDAALSTGIVHSDSNGDFTSSAVVLSGSEVSGTLPNANTTATASAGNSTIVARDGSGNFAAGTITASLTGNASTVTTNANLTGPITSSGNATSIASQTGTGTKFVVDTSPTIVTPTIAKLANLTTNGYVKTGSSDGTLSVQTVGIPVADGGTGQTTYTNGQLLIGNTSGNTLTKATLTQGTGITITNGNGTITIAASGGGAVGDSGIYVDTGNGRGSTNTRVRRFTNSRKASGTDLTYADSATLGASVTVNTAGVYAVRFCDSISAGVSNIAISVNGSALTTNASSITYAQGLRVGPAVVDNARNCVADSIYLSVNDVVRPQEDANTDGTNQQQSFSVTRVN